MPRRTRVSFWRTFYGFGIILALLCMPKSLDLLGVSAFFYAKMPVEFLVKNRLLGFIALIFVKKPQKSTKKDWLLHSETVSFFYSVGSSVLDGCREKHRPTTCTAAASADRIAWTQIFVMVSAMAFPPGLITPAAQAQCRCAGRSIDCPESPASAGKPECPCSVR